MRLHDVLVGENLRSGSHSPKVHLLVLDPHLIPRNVLWMLQIPKRSQTCCLHCSPGPSANAVEAARPLRNQYLTASENGDTAAEVSKCLVVPSLYSTAPMRTFIFPCW